MCAVCAVRAVHFSNKQTKNNGPLHTSCVRRVRQACNLSGNKLVGFFKRNYAPHASGLKGSEEKNVWPRTNSRGTRHSVGWFVLAFGTSERRKSRFLLCAVRISCVFRSIILSFI